jgi:hypothetical protein
LRQRHPDYTISACSHSQGTTVVTEALKELAGAAQNPADNWVSMQGAFPAHVFDTVATNLPTFTQLEQTVPTPNLYDGYGAGITNALRLGGGIVNFFNPVDFALHSGAGAALGGGMWEMNNGYYVSEGPVTMKPNTYLGYYTDGTSSLIQTNEYNQSELSLLYGGYYNGPIRSVTNLHELMPFVARARTKAVGAQAGVGGVMNSSMEVDLRSQFGFSREWVDHSGQFQQNLQYPSIWPFYFQLRTSLFPPQ